jgi:hypothetical protein
MTDILGSEIIDTDEYWHGFYKKQRPCLADLVLDESLGKTSEFYERRLPHPFAKFSMPLATEVKELRIGVMFFRIKRSILI